MHKNIIIDDALTQEEISILKDMSDKYKHELPAQSSYAEEYDQDFVRLPPIKIVKKDFGRLVIQRFEVPQEIINKVSAILEENGFSGYSYTNSTSYLEYGHEHGNPKLPQHKDNEPEDVLFIDYQLESNTDWGITIDGEQFDTKDNSIVNFYGSSQYHGRPFKVFKPGEFVTMLLMRFKKAVA